MIDEKIECLIMGMKLINKAQEMPFLEMDVECYDSTHTVASTAEIVAHLAKIMGLLNTGEYKLYLEKVKKNE